MILVARGKPLTTSIRPFKQEREMDLRQQIDAALA
jgi:hypothetical protein